MTPVGLRSLAPGHPDYKSNTLTISRARDAAHHQGTVWAWLIGPYSTPGSNFTQDDRAALHRAGLERGRGAALLGNHRRVIATFEAAKRRAYRCAGGPGAAGQLE